MRLDYKLEAIAPGAPVLEKTQKMKAQEDGQDLITPLVESAAEAVGVAVMAK
jgi:hypothetical protein